MSDISVLVLTDRHLQPWAKEKPERNLIIGDFAVDMRDVQNNGIVLYVSPKGVQRTLKDAFDSRNHRPRYEDSQND